MFHFETWFDSGYFRHIISVYDFDSMIEKTFFPDSLKPEAIGNLRKIIEATNQNYQEIYKRRIDRMIDEIRKEKFEEWRKEHATEN